jgi:LysM domain
MMSQDSIMQYPSRRRSTGSVVLRVIIWALALAAAVGAALSVDKVLRRRAGEQETVAPAVILPAPSGGPAQQLANAVETAAKDVAALTGSTVVGGRAGRDDSGRDEGGPAFDIARIEPSGDAVIAGRAAPGATVELLRNGIVHDRVVADASGQFAMVPPRLPAGDSELTLRTRQTGGRAATSRQSVVVAVQPNLKDQPVVALMSPDKPSLVLSKPPGEAASAGSVVVETVEAEPGGKQLYVSGRSSPHASVRLYINDSYQGATIADAGGRFTFKTTKDTAAKDSAESASGYRVRLDEVDLVSGTIRSRAEVPFTPPQAVASLSATGGVRSVSAAAAEPKGTTAVVSRGDSLWRISRAVYGDGARYTVIYDANHKQIRNPNRIYPGQIFILPGKGN